MARFRCFCLITLVLLVGCSRGPSDGFKGKRGQVSGTITVGDKPLPKGSEVMFIGKEGGFTATGTVDENGKYTLIYKEKSGLPEGDYLVQLSPPPATPASTGPVDPSQMGAKLKINKKGSDSAASSIPFAKKYLSTTTRKLTAKVEAKPNIADFKLDSE